MRRISRTVASLASLIALFASRVASAQQLPAAAPADAPPSEQNVPPPPQPVPEAPTPTTFDVPHGPTPPSDVPRETRWYGWQTLMADAVGVAALVGAADADRVGGRWLGAGTFMVAAPLVHALHGHWDNAGVSLLLHAPGALLIASMPVCDRSGGGHCPGDDGGVPIQPLLAMVAVPAGVLVDAIFIAHEDVSDDDEYEAARLQIVPVVAANGTSGVWARMAF